MDPFASHGLRRGLFSFAPFETTPSASLGTWLRAGYRGYPPSGGIQSPEAVTIPGGVATFAAARA